LQHRQFSAEELREFDELNDAWTKKNSGSDADDH